MTSVAIVMPAKNEPRLPDIGSWSDDLLVVLDSPHDSTPPNPWTVIQPEAGAANAIRYGINRNLADVVVLMCADGSDDPGTLDDLIAAIRRGATVAVADRYMAGGKRIGGPKIKHALSWVAGYCLGLDGTNLYKAYDGDWLRAQTIESRHGFTIGLELIAKARQQDRKVLRVPTVWTDRTAGRSHWRWSWLPSYARWWAAAMTARRSSSRPAPDTSSTSTAAPKA